MSEVAAATDVQLLAYLADRFERRVMTLPEYMDPSWLTADISAPTVLGDTDDGVRKHQLSRFFVRCCGSFPSLLDLVAPASRLSLHEREPLHARLCALALVARPGAIRCCVERGVRSALATRLGPAYERLRDGTTDGKPVPAAAAVWSPLEWACVGYADLAHGEAWPHISLRRLVRVSLPRHWTIDRSRRNHPRAQLRVDHALGRLDALFED